MHEFRMNSFITSSLRWKRWIWCKNEVNAGELEQPKERENEPSSYVPYVYKPVNDLSMRCYNRYDQIFQAVSVRPRIISWVNFLKNKQKSGIEADEIWSWIGNEVSYMQTRKMSTGIPANIHEQSVSVPRMLVYVVHALNNMSYQNSGEQQQVRIPSTHSES